MLRAAPSPRRGDVGWNAGLAGHLGHGAEVRRWTITLPPTRQAGATPAPAAMAERFGDLRQTADGATARGGRRSGGSAVPKASAETAARLRRPIQAVLDAYNAAHERAALNPTRWKGHLEHVLAAGKTIAAVKHHSATPRSDLPAVTAKLAEQSGMGALAQTYGSGSAFNVSRRDVRSCQAAACPKRHGHAIWGVDHLADTTRIRDPRAGCIGAAGGWNACFRRMTIL